MAKRFTDTGKWSKPFVRGLPMVQKFLWFYMLDTCDHAGVWDVELDVAAMRLGCDDLDESACLNAFGDHVLAVDGKWFIPDFIAFQYGELNESNRVHASVIQRLNAIGIDHKNIGAYKPLERPLQGCKDMDKDKDKDKDIEVSTEETQANKPKTKRKAKGDIDLSDLPEAIRTDEMHTAWMLWAKFRREKKAPLTDSTVEALLTEMSDMGEARAIAAINHTIKMGWQGLREPDGSVGKQASPGAGYQEPELNFAEMMAERDAKRFGGAK